ncbi:MAG: DUF4372 domain-containing protein [Acidobacteriota bacterium]|nr:DUF4372 domain-containing protein [Acidobacteriota bacterium]
MPFCQLAHTDSLREICNGLSCCLGKLVHLGIGRAPNKSTLSYANEHRPAALFEDLFFTAIGTIPERTRRRGRGSIKFRFKNKLVSLDSTTISLCLALFPWARFRRAKGGVKAHVLLRFANMSRIQTVPAHPGAGLIWTGPTMTSLSKNRISTDNRDRSGGDFMDSEFTRNADRIAVCLRCCRSILDS